MKPSYDMNMMDSCEVNGNHFHKAVNHFTIWNISGNMETCNCIYSKSSK